MLRQLQNTLNHHSTHLSIKCVQFPSRILGNPGQFSCALLTTACIILTNACKMSKNVNSTNITPSLTPCLSLYLLCSHFFVWKSEQDLQPILAGIVSFDGKRVDLTFS